MKYFLANNWLKLVAIMMLLGAVTMFLKESSILPNAYYQFMSWATVISSLTTGWQTYKSNRFFLMWIFVLVAIIYNPVAPILLNFYFWFIANTTVAIIFLLSFIVIKEKKI